MYYNGRPSLASKLAPVILLVPKIVRLHIIWQKFCCSYHRFRDSFGIWIDIINTLLCCPRGKDNNGLVPSGYDMRVLLNSLEGSRMDFSFLHNGEKIV